MSFLSKHKWKIIWGIVIVGILISTYWWGGNAPQLEGPSTRTEIATEIATEIPTTDVTDGPETTASVKAPTQKSRAETTPDVTLSPTEVTVEENICTLSVRCDTILNNITFLNPAKDGIIPPGGVIYGAKTVSFEIGESVFDILKREMQRNGIHLEFEKVPMYNSVYIEGIANIYEFDCGEKSGWIYRVNGVVPQQGCSQYKVEKGDRIEFIYTCEAGNDID